MKSSGKQEKVVKLPSPEALRHLSSAGIDALYNVYDKCKKINEFIETIIRIREANIKGLDDGFDRQLIENSRKTPSFNGKSHQEASQAIKERESEAIKSLYKDFPDYKVLLAMNEKSPDIIMPLLKQAQELKKDSSPSLPSKFEYHIAVSNATSEITANIMDDYREYFGDSDDADRVFDVIFKDVQDFGTHVAALISQCDPEHVALYNPPLPAALKEQIPVKPQAEVLDYLENLQDELSKLRGWYYENQIEMGESMDSDDYEDANQELMRLDAKIKAVPAVRQVVENAFANINKVQQKSQKAISKKIDKQLKSEQKAQRKTARSRSGSIGRESSKSSLTQSQPLPVLGEAKPAPTSKLKSLLKQALSRTHSRVSSRSSTPESSPKVRRRAWSDSIFRRRREPSKSDFKHDQEEVSEESPTVEGFKQREVPYMQQLRSKLEGQKTDDPGPPNESEEEDSTPSKGS